MAEPLERALEIIAQKKPRRAQPGMEAEGMRNVVMPMDGMMSQSYMDDLQGSAVLAAPRRVQASLASASDSEPEGSPSAFMTAGMRRGGMGRIFRPAPQQQQTGNCKDGKCGTGIMQGFVNDYNIPQSMGTRLINDGGMPVSSQPPVQTTVAQQQPNTQATVATGQEPTQATVRPRNRAQELLDEGRGDLDAANAAWASGNPSAAANNAFLGRARSQAGLNMIQNERELDLLERQQTQAELNAQVERKTQEFNLKAANENTVSGFAEITDSILAGEGDYAGQDAEVRATAAALYAQRMDATGNPAEAERLTVDDWKEVYRGKATAHDLGKLMARNSTVTPEGRFQFKQGLKESIDQVVLNRFYGKQDGTTKAILIGDALRNTMHQELDDILTRHIGGKILASGEGMNEEDALNLARDEAFGVVEDYFELVNGANIRYSGQQGGFWPMLQSLNPFGGGTSGRAEAQEAQPELPALPFP